MIRLLLLLLCSMWIVRAQGQAIILVDRCITGCNNSVIKTSPPLEVLYSINNKANPRLGLDIDLMSPWAVDNQVSLVLRSGNAEALRTTILSLLKSTFGPGVAQWQAFQVMEETLYNLTNDAILDDWWNKYSGPLMDAVSNAKNDIVAAPISISWWGLWHKKKTLADAGITLFPKNFSQFLVMLEILFQHTGKPPLCISHGDLWQALLWWSMIIQRIGGKPAWDRFLSKQMNAETDPVNLQALEFIGKLLPYFQQGPSTLTKGFGNTMGDWVNQECLLVLAYGAARNFPAPKKNISDYSWDRFPDADEPPNKEDSGEIASFVMMMANKNSLMVDKSVSFLKHVTSREYQRKLVPLLNGDLPADTQLQGLITDPEIIRGLNMMNSSSNIFNVADAIHPDWAIEAKPILVKIFTGAISISDAPQKLETVRQQVMLSTTVAPIYSISGFELTLTSDTPNATILYSLNDNTATYTYSKPIKLPTGENTVISFARIKGKADSTVEKWLIPVGNILYVGQILENDSNPTYYLLSFCMAVVGNWVALIIIEQAIYSNTKKLNFGTMGEKNDASKETIGWLVLATLAVTICQWGSISAAMAAITLVELQTTFQPISFEESRSLASILTPLIFIFSAFYLMTVSRKPHTNANGVVSSLAGSQSTKYDTQISIKIVDPASPATLASPTGPGSNLTIVNTKPTKMLRYLRYIWNRCDVYLASASLLMVASTVANYFTSMSSVILPCTIENNIGSIIVGTLVSWFFAALGLLMVFYYRETELRPIGALVMSGTVASVDFIITGGINFRYTGVVSDTSGISVLTLLSISAAVVALTSFILIAINVRKLKLSRDSTDSALLKANKEIAKRDDKLAKVEGAVIYGQWSTLLIRSAYTMANRKSHFLYPHHINDTTVIISDAEENTHEEKTPMAVKAFQRAQGKIIMPTMEEVLGNPITFEYFHRYAIEGRNGEKFKFLIDIEIFKLLHNPDQIRNAYTNIVETYIRQGSPMEINIGHVERITVLKASKTISLSVFDECLRVVKHLIKGNEWSKFSANFDQMATCANILQINSQVSTITNVDPKVVTDSIEKAINIDLAKKPIDHSTEKSANIDLLKKPVNHILIIK